MDFGNSNYQSLTNENTTDEGIEEIKTDIALIETQIVALNVKDELSYKINGEKEMALNYTPTKNQDLVTLKFFYANLSIMAYLEVSGNNEMVGSLRFQNSGVPLDIDGVHGFSNNNVLSRSNYQTFDYNFYLTNGYYNGSSLNDFQSNNSMIISHKDGKITLREATIDFDNNNIVNVASLNTISSSEINTLSGINTGTTIQTQLNDGMTQIASNTAEILNLQNDKVEKGINNFPQVFSISNQNNIDFTTTANFQLEAKEIVMIGDTEIKLDSTNSVLVNSLNNVNIKSHDILGVPSGDVILDAKNITIKGDANLGNVAVTGNIVDIIPNEIKINTLVGEININSETNTNIDAKNNISLTSDADILMDCLNTNVTSSNSTSIVSSGNFLAQSTNGDMSLNATQGALNIFSENTQMVSASAINLSTSVGQIHIDAKTDARLTAGNEALLEGDEEVQITSDNSIVLTNKNNNNLMFVTNTLPRNIASLLTFFNTTSFQNVNIGAGGVGNIVVTNTTWTSADFHTWKTTWPYPWSERGDIVVGQFVNFGNTTPGTPYGFYDLPQEVYTLSTEISAQSLVSANVSTCEFRWVFYESPSMNIVTISPSFYLTFDSSSTIIRNCYNEFILDLRPTIPGQIPLVHLEYRGTRSNTTTFNIVPNINIILRGIL